MIQLAIEGFMCAFVGCCGIAKYSMIWGARHYCDDLFRNDS